MLKWIVANIVGFVWRAAITLACIFTLQNIIQHSGYRVEFHTLFVAAICLIICIKIWGPSINS
jgi:hypothetical protein